ncbi:MAG: cation transporter [Anaerovoracaceae bacterium]|nr:cation transporter [Bacillota bacterium]MDY2671110.1 cation transporter [Anaerovoracaceae bacterium]
MIKKFKMQDVDCADCAAKMERNIKKIDGVNDATISFMTQKLTLDYEEGKLDQILPEAQKRVSRVDAEAKILY